MNYECEPLHVFAVCAPVFFSIRVKEEVGLLPVFLAWWLNQQPAQKYLMSSLAGRKYAKALPKKMFDNTPVPIPGIGEQKRIVRLSQLSKKKIKLMNDVLKTEEKQFAALALNLL